MTVPLAAALTAVLCLAPNLSRVAHADFASSGGALDVVGSTIDVAGDEIPGGATDPGSVADPSTPFAHLEATAPGTVVLLSGNFERLRSTLSSTLFVGAVTDVGEGGAPSVVSVGFDGGVGGLLLYDAREPAPLTPESVMRFRFSLGGINPGFAQIDSGYSGAYQSSQISILLPDVGDRIELMAIANPEPASGALFALAAVGLVALRRRRQSQALRRRSTAFAS